MKSPATIKQRAVSDLIPYARNARTHSDEQIAQIAGSIREFGFNNPVLVDKDSGIIAGHGRVLAARMLGLDKIPTIVLDHLDDTQRRAYILADNRLALNAGWDDKQLAIELKELGDDLDMTLAGFGEDEIAALIAQMESTTEGETDPDAAPALQEVATSQQGDIWVMNGHRLMCGSSMKADEVKTLMADEKADMVFTDPPYGVSYVGSSATKSIAGDITQAAIPISFKHICDIATKDDARVYFCGGSSNVQMYYSLFDVYLRSNPHLIIWDKGQFVMRPNNYHCQYEVIFFGWRGIGGGPKHWYSGRSGDEASDIWAVKRDSGKDYLHPTQKPVELPMRAIRNSAPPGGIVYEPFSGSGSCLIAAEKTARRCFAMELDPLYADVAVRRWQEFTEKPAIHEATGRTFDELSAEKDAA